MKKYRILSILTGVIFAVALGFVLNSCLKDDPVDIQKLELSVLKKDVFVGDDVVFLVIVGNKLVNADIYISGQKIIGNSYSFTSVGKFRVVAKLPGYLDSDEVEITVSELPKLVLTASKTNILRDETVTFTVTSEGKSVNADIYIGTQKITGNSYKFSFLGKFKVTAKLSGHLDSDEVEITVSELPKLVLTASKTSILRDETVTFTVTSEGKSVNADIYVGSQKITGTSYKFTALGKFKVTAKLSGHLDSDEAEITVSELPKLVLTASKTNILRDETVTFTVMSEGKSVNADIYIGTQKITGNSYKFSFLGKFKVTAKLSGHLDSDEVEITVSELPKLVLTASKTNILRDETVTFTVMSEGKLVNADIYIGTQKITGNSYKFSFLGKFRVVAKLPGYLDSDEAEITVSELPKLVLTASKTNILRDETVTFTVMSEGKSVNADIYIGPQKITGTSYKFTALGKFKVTAKLSGHLDSDEVEITVSELPKLVLTASKTSILRDETVTFTVMSEGKSVNADIYVGSQKITGTSYKFTTLGKFKVTAKLSGHLDSDEVEITVSELPKLVLTASKTNILRDETVTFTVTSEGKSVNADIYVGAQKITGTSYKFTSVGVFRVVAKQSGYLDSNETEIVVREPQYKTDIYIAGFEVSGASQIAKYWKNGVSVSLSSSANIAFATSIFVYYGDVYVAGFEESDNGITIAKYWRNGAAVNLTTGVNDAEASSIFVYNGDVYVAGFEKDGLNTVAKYWRNGVSVSLGNRINNSIASSIFVSNGDVYVAGMEFSGSNAYAKYWKNGASTNLSSGTYEAMAYSIFVSNNNVYIAGRDNNGSQDIAKYWRNNTSNTLSSSGVEATAYSVFYNDGYVYVAGFESSNAVYWRDGVRNVLSGGTVANSVFVLDGDVYIAGYEFNGNVFIAKYWKNGIVVNITDGANFANANDIFVVKELVE